MAKLTFVGGIHPYDGKDLSVTCIDGTTTVFHDFKLPRYNEAFQNNFTCKPEDRQSICYNFTVKRDRKNRQYIIVSVTMKLQAYENSYYGNGAISMDINYDHFALAEINETGKLLERNGYRIKVLNTINFRKSMHYNRATCSPLKRWRTALFQSVL